jgi:hypothetical protein
VPVKAFDRRLIQPIFLVLLVEQVEQRKEFALHHIVVVRVPAALVRIVSGKVSRHLWGGANDVQIG